MRFETPQYYNFKIFENFYLVLTHPPQLTSNIFLKGLEAELAGLRSFTGWYWNPKAVACLG